MKYTELLTFVNLFLRLQITFQNSYWHASASPSSEAPPALSPPVLGALQGADSLPAAVLHLVPRSLMLKVKIMNLDFDCLRFSTVIRPGQRPYLHTLHNVQMKKMQKSPRPLFFYKITDWSKSLYWLKKAPSFYYNWDYSQCFCWPVN